jgi:flavodoxin/ferredoxin
LKCILIYFSQTGNTEKVARAIQSGVKQATGHCDIVKIKDANPLRLYEYDLIGLGSPVIGAEPGNVSAFINNIRFAGGKHIFVFATHGTQPQNFFPSIVPKLKRRGLIVIGTRDWYGNCCSPESPIPFPTAGHPDEIDLKEAKEFGKEIVERSLRISVGETELIPPVPKPPPLRPVEPPPVKKFKDLAKLNMEKCIYPECRLCMDNCPMDGIDLTVTPPVFAHPCIDCVFCARICPTGAIDADVWAEAMAQIVAWGLPVILLPALEKAEAEGSFRRLVPLEDIGEKPVYKVYNKHPQWIIGKGLQKTP